jgi:predicted CopG family antitoxin
MKGSDQFKEVISEYLENRAKTDSLFAEVFKKKNKSIDKCISYILNEVQKSGRNGFTDDEIFGMAVHYYDEDGIRVKDLSASVQVVVNRTIDSDDRKTPTEKPKPSKPKRDPDNYPFEQLSMF